MTYFKSLSADLKNNPKKWLITGVAGFIGSNLLESLLELNQDVVGLDNLETGSWSNLTEVKSLVSDGQWSKFKFIKGDIRNLLDCKDAVSGVDYVLHQAALGSVPRSIANPVATNEANVDGFLNMLIAARDANVSRFVYAASSSTYGDDSDLPKIEGRIGNPLSPYAVTKLVNELYADVFAKTYNFSSVGLRYFNVFGRRQDPNGAYAAVIPKWTASLLNGEDIYINGDGETSRDFCYVDNVVQANLLAAANQNLAAQNNIYNIAFGQSTSLNELCNSIIKILAINCKLPEPRVLHRNFREGDVRHSLADISKARMLLGYDPKFDILTGLNMTMPWYVSKFK